MTNDYQWYTPNKSTQSADGFHQVMALGKIDEIHAVIADLGLDQSQKLFIEFPAKVYYPATYFFIKNYILKITENLDEQQYFKISPRTIR